MNQTTKLLSLNLNSEAAVERIMDRFKKDGLQVIRSFDLQSAKAAHVDCSCPRHATNDCNCQLVVMLVYDRLGTMVTLVAHSNDEQTHFVLVEFPNRIEEQGLKNKVMQALAVEGFAILRSNSK